MEIFELGDIAKILRMPITKVKNWTIGRPLEIAPSIRPASGHGSRSLYGMDDLYLFALANELSKAGLAAKAIGKVMDAAKAKFPDGIGAVETLWISRGPKLTYRIESRERRLPGDAVVRLTVDVQAIRDNVGLAVKKLG